LKAGEDMTTRRLHVWMVDNAAHGAPFLADVWTMLLRIAHGSGCVVASTTHDTTSRWAEIRSECPRVLAEVGAHRAQYIPNGGSTGRIETSLVGVEVLRPGEQGAMGRPTGPILKTYIYPQRRVTVHSTGEQVALDIVLACQAGPTP